MATQAIHERDAAESWADGLADLIGTYFGQDVGEHSSAHSPWETAREIIQEARPYNEHWQQIPLGMPDEGRVVLLMYHGREVAFTVNREPATMHGARPIIGLPVGATHWRAA